VGRLPPAVPLLRAARRPAASKKVSVALPSSARSTRATR
jgi:hypothetical protein